jgi:hypothetical protein
MASLLAALLTILSAERRLKNAISFLAIRLRVLLFYKRMAVLGEPSGAVPATNRVVGNYIGTNISGTAALGNPIGVFIGVGESNIIGGTTPQERNVISGNQLGVYSLATRSLATALSAIISARKLTAALLYPILCTATS